MSETYSIRKKLLDIARKDKGKVEVTKNRAPWIEKYWPATTNEDGYKDRGPYCAAAVAYWVREWLNDGEVRRAFGFTPEQAEKWRCKSALVFDWINWASLRKLTLLPRNCILHAGDLVVYSYSHIEIVTDDDNTTDGPFVAIGANTNAAGSRDSEGCVEKPRSRNAVKSFIRMLP